MTPQIQSASSTPVLKRPALNHTGTQTALFEVKKMGLAHSKPSLFGQVQFLGALKRDQVQFGNDNQNNTPPAPDGNAPVKSDPVNTDQVSPPEAPAEDGPPDETAPSPAPAAPLTTWGKIKATARFLFNLPEHFRNFKKFFNSDNATLARGLFFKQVLPIIISLGAFIPVYGIPIAILGIPVSMISGRYGTSVLNKLKNKDNAQLSEPLKNIARIDEILGNPNKATSPTEIIDRINKALDDALDIKKFPFMDRIVRYLRPTQNNFLGRILGQWQRFALLANINVNVAKEESIGKATYAGIKGGFQFLFWATLVPKVGMMLEKGSRFMPAPLSWICKGLGWLMEYAGLLRFAADLTTNPKPPASQPA